MTSLPAPDRAPDADRTPLVALVRAAIEKIEDLETPDAEADRLFGEAYGLALAVIDQVERSPPESDPEIESCRERCRGSASGCKLVLAEAHEMRAVALHGKARGGVAGAGRRFSDLAPVYRSLTDFAVLRARLTSADVASADRAFGEIRGVAGYSLMLGEWSQTQKIDPAGVRQTDWPKLKAALHRVVFLLDEAWREISVPRWFPRKTPRLVHAVLLTFEPGADG